MDSVRSRDQGDAETNYFTGANQRGAGVYVRGASDDARKTESAAEPAVGDEQNALTIVTYRNGVLINPDTDARWFPAGTPEYEQMMEAVKNAQENEGG